MDINFNALLVSSLVPLVVGSIWYHPKITGNVWMKLNGFNENDLAKSNMFIIFGLTLVFSFFLSFIILMLTVHQLGPLGMIGGPKFAEAAKPSFHEFMSDYGTAFRTFKHGALHGFMSGLFFALPLVGIVGLFERKSWKYILIHTGYWTLVFTIMGAIVCGWV